MKIVIITGADSGLGFKTAKKLQKFHKYLSKFLKYIKKTKNLSKTNLINYIIQKILLIL